MSDDFSYPSSGAIHSRIKHSLIHDRSWWADFRAAAGFLIWMAGGISLWAAGVALRRHQIFFPDYGVTIWSVFESYWLSALIGLLPLTFIMPLTRFRWGHAFAGYVLAFVFYGVTEFRLPSDESVPVKLAVAFICGFIGLGVGIVTFDDEHGDYLSSEARAARIVRLVVVGVLIIGVVWAVLNPPFCLFPTYCHR